MSFSKIALAAFVAALVAFAAIPARAESATTTTTSSSDSSVTCDTFTRCSECLFDAAVGLGDSFLNCSWCPSEKKCVSASSAVAGVCATPKFSTTAGFVCDDMQCSASRTTNNIYLCRANLMIGLIASAFLIVFSVLYYLWWSAIVQMPFRYPNIHQATKQYISSRGSILASWKPSNDSERASASTDRSAWAPKAPGAVPPEDVHWSAIARWAFLPLFVGSTCGILSFFMLLTVSFKPWFADFYYGVMIIISYAIYAAFCTYVYKTRMPIPGDERQTLSVFFQLAWLLRGRDLRAVFQIQENDAPAAAAAAAAAAAPGSPGSPTPAAAPALPHTAVNIDKEKKADTTKLLNFEESIDKDIRKALQDSIAHDEFILWWEAPQRNDILVDNRWMLHLFGNFMALGIWMWVSSGISEDKYGLTRFFGSTSLSVFGIVVFILGGIGMAIVVHGANRFYVMTNKRLINLADGFGSITLTSTDIATIKCASVTAYQDMFFDPIMTFSWEGPTQVRRMPPIKTNAFACIRSLDTFLPQFREIAGTLNSKILEDNAQHQRMIWRMHICINIVILTLLPIIFLYTSFAPLDTSVIGMLIFVSFCAGLIQRGLRVQHLTIMPLNLVKEWSKWDTRRGSVANAFLRRLFERGAASPTTPAGENKSEST